jgi:hypothetical protein
VPTGYDLTTQGATAAVNGALFFQSSASGIQEFVRLGSNQTLEQGYNTDYRPVQFDEVANSGNIKTTSSLQLSSVPMVISSGGLAYYEFLLNINQLGSNPLLSLDELRFYVTNGSTVDPTLLHNYNLTTHTLQDDGGNLYSPVYDLNPTTPAANYLILNFNLATGNSTGDMIALIPATALGTNLSQYVYLYSKLGVHNSNNDGPDEWATADALPVGSITGKAFVDNNGNGALDAGEAPMVNPQVQVFLDANNNGILDPGEISTTTSALDGSFSFSRLLAGTYHVREVLPTGWIQTAAINTDITLTPGQNATGVAMGDFKLITVSGTKFEDQKGDGLTSDQTVLNSANPDFVPVTLQLLKGSTVVATTVTGNDGTYTFSGVGPGTYTVSEVKPNGWIQTAARGTTFTAMSGVNSTGNDFDNYLVAQIINNNVLAVRTTKTGSGSLVVAQDPLNNNNFKITEDGQSAGTFVVGGLIKVQVTTFGGFSIDTTGVTTLPVTSIVQGGNNTFAGGSSGTTVALNSQGSDSLSVAGGQNTLNFAPTGFGVTYNAGIQGQSQPLDSTHSLTVSGAFQTVDGTNFSDLFTAALPTFNPSTGFIGQGITIFSGLGQDTIIGTLGTNAQTDGAGSSYTQVLSSTAISDLVAAFGSSATNLGGFVSTVTANGGSTTINASLLTNVTLNANNNAFHETVDSNAFQVLQQAISSFGSTVGNSGGFGNSLNNLGGFGNTVSATGGFSSIQTSLLTSVTISGTNNSYVQSLDPNSTQLLLQAINQFGNTLGNSGGFGNSLGNAGGFGNTVSATGGFNSIQTSLMTSVNAGGDHNNYTQFLDANSATVLEAAIQRSFGNTVGNSGGFGNTLNNLGGFGNTLATNGGFNNVQTSLLSNVTLNGSNNLYIQSLDANSTQVLLAAMSGFGNTVGNNGGFGNTVGATGGFGSSLGNAGGFGNTVSATGGFNQVLVSLATNFSSGGDHNTYFQVLDSNSKTVLDAAVTSFGSSVSASGGFGNSLNNLGGFGNSLTATGGFNKVQVTELTTVSLGGGNNTYFQGLDANSAEILNRAISGFGSTVGNSGGFGSSLGASGGFGNSVTMNGGFNVVETSVITSVTITGTQGNNAYLQALDGPSTTVLQNALTTFGSTVGNSGGFGNSLNNLGGFGNTVSVTGGFNDLVSQVLTNITASGGNNTYTQGSLQGQVIVDGLDSNSTQLLGQALTQFGSALGNSGGFGGTISNTGGFGNTVAVTGGYNTITISSLTNVTASGGYNLISQAWDDNSTHVLNQVITAVQGFGNTATNLGGFGNTVSATGGFNNATTGPLTTVNLADGYDTYVEQFNANALSIATTLLNAAGTKIGTVAGNLGPSVNMGNGNEVVVGGLLGQFKAGNGNNRFVIEDPSLLGAAGAGANLFKFGGNFTSGTGNNTYYFVGQNLGHVAVNQANSAGIDILDFSRFQSSGITINLGLTGEQSLAPGLFLTLSDGMGFSNVVGTGLSDTITLNGRNGTISGQALLDPLAANAPAPHAVTTQYVFLDFNTYTTDPTTQHVYTPDERNAILAILQSDYAQFPFVQFTLTAPTTTTSFETVFFNRPTGTSEGGSGGNSSKIDFRDLSQTATAEVNINAFVGTSPGEVPNIVDPVTGYDTWATMSGTIAAHETGHILGLLHEFSMGPVGFAINNLPGNAAYRPSYPGPDAAWETTMHIMASPASVGSTLLEAAGHPFFGEREAIALAYINDGTVVDNTQATVTNNSKAQAQQLNLVGLQVPNPATSGFEYNMQYSVAATDVVDYIGLDNTGHSQDKWYSFVGKQGDLMNFDVMSYHLTRITDPVDTVLTIYDSTGAVVAYYNGGAVNDDNFETADAHIIDLTLPASGTYYVKVDSFTDPTIQPGQPGYNPGEATDTLTGHYELLIYRSTVGNKISPTSHDTVALGSGQDTIYGVDPSNPMVNPQAVTYNGVEGNALSLAVATFSDPGTPASGNFSAVINWGDGTSTSAGTVSINGNTVTILGSHAYAEEGTYTTTLTLNQGTALSVILKGKSVVSDAQLTNATSSNLVLFEGLAVSTQVATFTDLNPRGPISDFTATISWGDGSSSAGVITQPNGIGTAFTVTGSHAYAVPGSDTVKVTITDIGGATTSTTFVVTVQPSIIVLNPTVSGALTLTGSVSINITGAVIVDSSSASALTATGSSKLTAGTIQVVGGVSANNNLSPAPITAIKSIADPLAGLGAPAPGTNRGSINLTKSSQSTTINPGIYTSISVSGTGTTLTMNPGVYIIAGGGFSVSNSSIVNGTGVTIYNTGSNFLVNGTDSGTFGAISLGSSGSVNLSAPTTGPYAGILIFQSRNNTRAMSLNASSVVGLSGVIYAPNALLSLGGSATLKTPAIVGQLSLNGNGGSALTTAGTDNSGVGTAGQLLGNDLFLYVNDPSGLFNSDELARLADAISGLDNLLVPYSVTITEVSDSTLANLVLDTGATSAAGGLADGVLGCYVVSDGVTGEITLIQGWNWYTGADPSLVGSNQYDFQTILTHEMGHALGLGHSVNPDSVMFASLGTGNARRTMTVQDLNIPDPGTGPDGLHAAQPASGRSESPIRISEFSGLGFQGSGFGLDPNSRGTTLAFQAGATGSGFSGFGFALAEFSGHGPAFAASRLSGLEIPGLDARWNSSPSLLDSESSPDLAIDEADIISEGTAAQGDFENWHRNPGQSSPIPGGVEVIHQESSEKQKPSLNLSNDGLWDSFETNLETTPLSYSGVAPDSTESSVKCFWDLDEPAGWLLFGMFLVPPVGASSSRLEVGNSKIKIRNGKQN